jgi:hypothetical protein
MTDYQTIWRQEPLVMQRMLWPHVTFYDRQVEIIHSVRDNLETYVPAGNQLGKDFVAGFIILWFFISHLRVVPKGQEQFHRVRVVTTSVKDDHLDVLWGEIGGYIASSKIPLSAKQGGPLVINAHEIRHISEMALTGGNAGSYVKGQVSAKGEGMQGHHGRDTLLVVDEASGVDGEVFKMASTWAKRKLVIGNPHPCNNQFFQAVEAGDILA